MHKVFGSLLTLAVLLGACAQPGGAETPQAGGASTRPPASATAASDRCGDRSQLASELHLYTWVDYMDPAIPERFEQECGVTIVETNFESNEILLATLQAGSTGYDLIVPSDYMVQTLIAEGRLEPLNFDHIPNMQHIGPAHRNTYFDPEQQYTVPYFWGTSGLAVDTTVVPDPEPSWKLVFAPSAEVCGKISMLDDQRETIGAALMYLGYSINDTDPAHLEAAKNLLIEQAQCVKAYDSQTNDDLIVQGETVVAHMWTGDAILAGDPSPEAGGRAGIAYLIPAEGCTIWQDNLAIPAGAPSPYTAEVFINFLLDPEIAAQNAAYVGYGTPNEAARQLLDPEVLNNRGIYPDAQTMGRLQWIEDVGDALALYDRVWTEFKAAAGG